MSLSSAFLDYYRSPDQCVSFRQGGEPRDGDGPGYFRFGPDVTCFGRCASASFSGEPDSALDDVRIRSYVEGSACVVPFDPTEVADNLRQERYVPTPIASQRNGLIRTAYYGVRPLLPVGARKHLQRLWLRGKTEQPFPHWPVDCTVDRLFEKLMGLCTQANSSGRVPFIWFWPDGKAGAAILTHDVETQAGLMFCSHLMDINQSFGVKASFQLIPAARYEVSEQILREIRTRGHEINVHDLKHDGHLFADRARFIEAAQRINDYGRKFEARGFRSGALYRKPEWYDALTFSYDMSIPNVGHLEAQPGGCCTVMPYFIGDILEIPVTTTQDYSLFNILGSHSIDLWMEQTRLIMKQHGLLSFIVHPDYLRSEPEQKTYESLLSYLTTLRSHASLWMALPGQVDEWWRQRHKLRLVSEGDSWTIQGVGAERARLAYAELKDGELHYSLESASVTVPAIDRLLLHTVANYDSKVC